MDCYAVKVDMVAYYGIPVYRAAEFLKFLVE
jgi:hypothetical protein